jgi:hypothetical protein
MKAIRKEQETSSGEGVAIEREVVILLSDMVGYSRRTAEMDGFLPP